MEDKSTSYELPLETLPGLDYENHLNDLIELRAFFDGCGARTAGTRIDRYIDYIQGLVSGSELDVKRVFKAAPDRMFNNKTDLLLYVLREVHELMWIQQGLKAHWPTGVDEKLDLIVGGSDFAALDGSSVSRDTQFELRIASYFCQSGCLVYLSTETDVVAKLNDVWNSISNARELEKAAKQKTIRG